MGVFCNHCITHHQVAIFINHCFLVSTMSHPVVSTSHYYLNRFRTNVRRQDSTSAVAPLGDELREFLHSSYPDWSSSMITPGFQYDTKKLQKTEGFPEVARDMVKSRSSDARDMIKWTSEAMGMRAEEK